MCLAKMPGHYCGWTTFLFLFLLSQSAIMRQALALVVGTCAVVVAKCCSMCSHRCEPAMLIIMQGSLDSNNAALHDMPTPYNT